MAYTLHTVPWEASTPGTKEQLNAIATFKRHSLADLAALSDANFAAYANDVDVLCHVRDNGIWRWVAGTSPAVNGYSVIASAGGNRWVKQFEGSDFIGGKLALADALHPAKNTKGARTAYSNPSTASSDYRLVLLAPGKYTAPYAGFTLQGSLCGIKSPFGLSWGEDYRGAQIDRLFVSGNHVLSLEKIAFVGNELGDHYCIGLLKDAGVISKSLTFIECFFKSPVPVFGFGVDLDGEPFGELNQDVRCLDCVFDDDTHNLFGIMYAYAVSPGEDPGWIGNFTFERCQFKGGASLTGAGAHHTEFVDCVIDGQVLLYGLPSVKFTRCTIIHRSPQTTSAIVCTYDEVWDWGDFIVELEDCTVICDATNGKWITGDADTELIITGTLNLQGTARAIDPNIGSITINSNSFNRYAPPPLFDDFDTGSLAGRLGWLQSNIGTSTAASLVTTGVDTTDRAIGVVQLGTGSTSTGRSGHYLGPDIYALGPAQLEWEGRVKIADLSTSGQRFAVYAGLLDNANAAGDVTDGLYFRYSDNAASGNWQICSANNSTRTQTDSTIAATTGWTHLRVVATTSSAKFYINGVLAGTVTTNLPAAGRFFGQGFKIEKSVGTTARTFLADYASLQTTWLGTR